MLALKKRDEKLREEAELKKKKDAEKMREAEDRRRKVKYKIFCSIYFTA